jgi:hypothetical protein
VVVARAAVVVTIDIVVVGRTTTVVTGAEGGGPGAAVAAAGAAAVVDVLSVDNDDPVLLQPKTAATKAIPNTAVRFMAASLTMAPQRADNSVTTLAQFGFRRG